MRHLYSIIGLTVLIFLLDLLFRPIYANVDLIRATLVGLTAYAVLFGLSKMKPGLVNPLVGALAIFSSAFFSVILIQAGVLVSQSTISGFMHIVILSATYLIAVSIFAQKKPAP